MAGTFHDTAQEPDFEEADLPIPYELRGQIRGLGVAWILLGLLCLGLAVFMSRLPDDSNAPELLGNIIVPGAYGLCWIACGIGALGRKLWGIRGGMAASYASIALWLMMLMLAANASRSTPPPSGLALIIQFFILRKAHRVLRWNKRLGEYPALT